MRRMDLFALAAFNAALMVSAGCSEDPNVEAKAGAWAPTGALAIPRSEFITVALTSGRVLVAGGQIGAGAAWEATATAELYDPATRAWTVVAPMMTKRSTACAALLQSGKVLVAGGSNPVDLGLSTAEVYDPMSNTWTPTGGPMTTPHDIATCTPLPSGEVLVVGGLNVDFTGSTEVAELYDPTSGLFTPTGSLVTARYFHTATVLASGKVLVAGGCVGAWPCVVTTASAELYDPVTKIWSGVGALPIAVFAHTATLLASGEVLVAAGCHKDNTCGDGADDKRVSLYDPAARTWRATGATMRGHVGHVALLLSTGDVLLAGGTGASGAGGISERYVQRSFGWEFGPTMFSEHGNLLGAAKLPDGTWLVVGGVRPATPNWVRTGAAEIFTE
jgi:hypothetical protein